AADHHRGGIAGGLEVAPAQRALDLAGVVEQRPPGESLLEQHGGGEPAERAGNAAGHAAAATSGEEGETAETEQQTPAGGGTTARGLGEAIEGTFGATDAVPEPGDGVGVVRQLAEDGVDRQGDEDDPCAASAHQDQASKGSPRPWAKKAAATSSAA